MKKGFLMGIMVLLCLSLCACGQVRDIEDVPVEEASAEEVPVEEAPVEEAPIEELPVQDNTVSIPKKIYHYTGQGNMGEHVPCITFHEDMQCTLHLNMLEWLLDLPATYEVMVRPDGKRLIKCDYQTTEIGDGLERRLSYCYLVEETPDQWTFYGEYMGTTWCKDTFFPMDTEEIGVQKKLLDGIIQIGEYKMDGQPFDFLKVLQLNEDLTIEFSVEWYRLAGMYNADAVIYGNVAVFNYEREDGYDKTTGFLEFLQDGSVVLTVLTSEIPYMENGSRFVYA